MERLAQLARYLRGQVRSTDDDDDGVGRKGCDGGGGSRDDGAAAAHSFPMTGLVERILQGTTSPGSSPIVEVAPGSSTAPLWPRATPAVGDGARRPNDIWDALVSILLWDDVASSFLVFLAFNSIFW